MALRLASSSEPEPCSPTDTCRKGTPLTTPTPRTSLLGPDMSTTFSHMGLHWARFGYAGAVPSLWRSSCSRTDSRTSESASSMFESLGDLSAVHPFGTMIWTTVSFPA